MSIYTIGDLHLSFGTDKPMDIFGYNWENHSERIKNNWLNTVRNEDTVILPGDFSWSTYLEDTYEDFRFLNSLPGKKIMSKGNHDYWKFGKDRWESLINLDHRFIEHELGDNVVLLGWRTFRAEPELPSGGS